MAGRTRSGERARWAAIALVAIALPAHPASLSDKRAALAALNAREAALSAEIGANRNALARLLGALELFSRDPPPALLVSPGDAKDAVRAMILARAIAPTLEARAKALAAEADALARTRRAAAEAAGELFSAESALEDRESRLSALTDDAALLSPPSARGAAQALEASAPPGSLIAPARGVRSAGFGGRLPGGLRSQGVAWKTAPGATVVSPAAAVVAYAGPVNGWGQVVILRAAGGCHMVLSGLGKVTVTGGQSVAAAFPLGSMPANGLKTPELYFEVRLASGPIDPTTLMRGGPGAPASARGANINAARPKVRREGAG